MYLDKSLKDRCPLEECEFLKENYRLKIRKVIEMKVKWLVCGSRIINIKYKDLVFKTLDEYIESFVPLQDENGNYMVKIIQGECPNSADVYSKEWAESKNISVESFPGTKGNYLTRNVEMVNFSDEIIAFWNGYSYGTAHTIAQGILQGKEVTIIDTFKELITKVNDTRKGKLQTKNRK